MALFEKKEPAMVGHEMFPEAAKAQARKKMKGKKKAKKLCKHCGKPC